MLGSPFMARLCQLFVERLVAGDVVSDTLLAWPADGSALQKLVALRIAGALHALVLEGRSESLKTVYPPNDPTDRQLWSAVQDALRIHADFVMARLQQAPQTNEVRRAAIIVPGFLAVAERTGLPLVMSEIGASAGINMQWDTFGYRFGDTQWGDPSSQVQLAPEWRGVPPPHGRIQIRARAGCDLLPIDPSDPEARLRMLSYIWADQPERLARTNVALDLAARAPERVEAADVVDWLPARLAHQSAGTTHVVYHTIVWQYFDASVQAEAKAMIESAGSKANEERPLAWLAFEADQNPHGAALRLRLWPGDVDQVIARADFHGRWVEWRGLS